MNLTGTGKEVGELTEVAKSRLQCWTFEKHSNRPSAFLEVQNILTGWLTTNCRRKTMNHESRQFVS